MHVAYKNILALTGRLMTDNDIAIIGGWRPYAISELEDAHWQSLSTPLGTPSDDILSRQLNRVSVDFLPWQGASHFYPPQRRALWRGY